jgi:hypothetical protein
MCHAKHDIVMVTVDLQSEWVAESWYEAGKPLLSSFAR